MIKNPRYEVSSVWLPDKQVADVNCSLHIAGTVDSVANVLASVIINTIELAKDADQKDNTGGMIMNLINQQVIEHLKGESEFTLLRSLEVDEVKDDEDDPFGRN